MVFWHLRIGDHRSDAVDVAKRSAKAERAREGWNHRSGLGAASAMPQIQFKDRKCGTAEAEIGPQMQK